MKLVDILARELKVWPENCECVWQVLSGRLAIDKDRDRLTDSTYTIARDWHEARVTRAEWQAAVNALNAPKVVEWDGAGNPAMGSSIEYSIGDGWYPCEVRYVLNRDDCPGIALIAWCEHLGKDQYLSNDRDHRFRPVRTAEQVAAEEREKAIADLYFTINWNEGRETWPFISNGRKADYEKAIDAGYTKVAK